MRSAVRINDQLVRWLRDVRMWRDQDAFDVLAFVVFPTDYATCGGEPARRSWAHQRYLHLRLHRYQHIMGRRIFCGAIDFGSGMKQEHQNLRSIQYCIVGFWISCHEDGCPRLSIFFARVCFDFESSGRIYILKNV